LVHIAKQPLLYIFDRTPMRRVDHMHVDVERRRNAGMSELLLRRSSPALSDR
jgi:hypothetical protein